jgi:O-antigen/teichoic acid export membrane protein
MGLHSSNSYYIARNRKLLLPLLSNTIFVSLIVGSSLAVLTIASFSIYPDLAPLRGPLLILVLVWVPFGLAYLLLQNLLIGIQDIRAYNIIEVGNRIISVLLMTALISINFVTVESVYIAGFVALIVSIIWVFFQFRVSILTFPTPSLPLFFENIRYGIKAYLSALFAFILLRIDLLMVKYILGAIQAGYYAVAVSLADMFYMLPAVVGTIIFPKLSAMENDVEKWRYTKKVTLYLGIALSLIVILAIPVAKPIIRLLYGKAFLPAVPAFVVLGIATLFYGISNMFSNCLAAMNFPWFVVNIFMAVAVVNVLLNIFMIKIFGIMGASFSSLICYFILMLSQYIYLKRRERIIES